MGLMEDFSGRMVMSWDMYIGMTMSVTQSVGAYMMSSMYMFIAMSLGVIAGADNADPLTAGSAGKAESDYTRYLEAGSLKGARIGVARDFGGEDPEITRVFEESLAALARLGADIIDPIWFPQYVHAVANEPVFPLIRNAEFKAQALERRNRHR